MKKCLKFILSLLLLLACFGCANKNERITDGRTAIVYSIIESNGVYITREGTVDTAYVGMRLLAGDILSTDKSSKVYIRVDNDKNILLGYSSKMEITELTNGKLSLTLLEGEFFFDVENKLEDDEEMSFNISNTTMSIRGTSGGGRVTGEEGMLSIYTGVGEIEVKNGEQTVTLQVLPGTKATFEKQEESQEVVSLDTLTAEDIPDVQSYYLNENNDYKDKLVEDGWEIPKDGEITPPETPIEEPTQQEESQTSYVGWRQARDGSWYFDMEDFINGIGPTPYDPNTPHECEHCKGIYVDATEEPHLHLLDCGHYECQVNKGSESLHQLCKYKVNGKQHYCCEEGHGTCCKCGVCSFATTLTKYKGNYYCSDCYKVQCAHCHQYYTLPEAYKHNILLNNKNFPSYSSELCGVHYFCELDFDETKLDEHKTCPNELSEKHSLCKGEHDYCSIDYSSEHDHCLIKTEENTCIICNRSYCKEHLQSFTTTTEAGECICYYCINTEGCLESNDIYTCAAFDDASLEDNHCHIYRLYSPKCIEEGLAFKCNECGKIYCLQCKDYYLNDNGDGTYTCKEH